MRRRCTHCRTEFRPKRSDAKFCGDLCRQAAHKMRHKAADAAAEAAIAGQRKAEALRVFDQLNANQLIANVLHHQAKAAGVDVAFTPASNGVLAVEGRPGALDEASNVIESYAYLSVPDCPAHDGASTLAVESAKVYRLFRSAADALEMEDNYFGGSLVAREAAAECREAVARGGNVYELRAKQDYVGDRNRAARLRNDGAKFFGLKGFRCRCGKSWAGDGQWNCCGESIAQTPDAPRGFPLPHRGNG